MLLRDDDDDDDDDAKGASASDDDDEATAPLGLASRLSAATAKDDTFILKLLSRCPWLV